MKSGTKAIIISVTLGISTLVVAFGGIFILLNFLRVDIGDTGPVVGLKFGGEYMDEILDIVQTSDDGYLFTGWTLGRPVGEGTEVWVIKTNSSGQIEWNHTFLKSSQSAFLAISETDSGNFLLTGYFQNTTGSSGWGRFGWLVKFDKVGNLLWEKAYSESYPSSFFAIKKTTNDEYILVGDNLGCFLLKIDENGNTIWEETVPLSTGSSCESVHYSEDGGYLFRGVQKDYNFSIVKTNSDGIHEWNVTIPSLEHPKIIDSSIYSFTVAGLEEEDYQPIYAIYTYDYNGSKLISGYYGNSSISEFGTAIKTSDEGYLLTGTIWTSPYIQKIWVCKIDSNLNQLWNKTYGGDTSQIIGSIIELSNGGYAFGGQIHSSGPDYDAYFIITDAQGIPLFGE